ncbi:MAG: Fe-S cluster assembly scaffold protein NifU [bacterium]|nr:MAG: Fe-S cluster assembly scaffold protein NifU [bacterium]
MKPTQYSDKVLNHFKDPRNVGTLEGDDVGVGRVGNPVCGDLMEIYIKVENDVIEDVKFKTFGCGSAIATASMITELAKGKLLEEAERITRQDVADELDGLPPVKMHCSNLAADALKNAIESYREKQGDTRKGKTEEPAAPAEIAGKEEFLGKGVFAGVKDPAELADMRVLVVDTGDEAAKLAVELTKHTPRVVFLTSGESLSLERELRKALERSAVKILYESKLLSIGGAREVEQVRIHDLNEDEEYDLFVDAVIIL